MATAKKPSKKTNGMVAVGGDASLSKEFGRLVGWDLNGETSITDLQEASSAHGIDTKDQCEETPNEKALLKSVREAMPETKFRYEVLKKPTGLSVKSRHDTHDDKGKDVKLETELRVFINEADGSLRFEPGTHQNRVHIEKAYTKWKTHVTGTRYSTWLITQLNKWFVTKVLRGKGGCYFIPSSCLDDWNNLVELTKEVTPHVINEIGCFPSDDRAVASVLSGIGGELKQRIISMNDALEAHADGEAVLGLRALVTLKTEIETLEEKMKFYEELLGKSLDTYRASFEDLELTVSQAMVAVEAEKIKEEKAAKRAKGART